MTTAESREWCLFQLWKIVHIIFWNITSPSFHVRTQCTHKQRPSHHGWNVSYISFLMLNFFHPCKQRVDIFYTIFSSSVFSYYLSNQLLNPTTEFLISVIVFFNSRIFIDTVINGGYILKFFFLSSSFEHVNQNYFKLHVQQLHVWVYYYDYQILNIVFKVIEVLVGFPQWQDLLLLLSDS